MMQDKMCKKKKIKNKFLIVIKSHNVMPTKYISNHGLWLKGPSLMHLILELKIYTSACSVSSKLVPCHTDNSNGRRGQAEVGPCSRAAGLRSIHIVLRWSDRA